MFYYLHVAPPDLYSKERFVREHIETRKPFLSKKESYSFIN